jgi:hypothetical protein
MDRDNFINQVNNTIRDKEACLILMKRAWIKMSIREATDLVKKAFIHNFPKNNKDIPFPKTIQGVLYESAGHFIYGMLTEDQKASIERSPN